MSFPIKGKLIYIGRGVYDPNCPLNSRCLNHEDDELAKHLNKNVSIERVHPKGRNLSYDIADKINN